MEAVGSRFYGIGRWAQVVFDERRKWICFYGREKEGCCSWKRSSVGRGRMGWGVDENRNRRSVHESESARALLKKRVGSKLFLMQEGRRAVFMDGGRRRVLLMEV